MNESEYKLDFDGYKLIAYVVCNRLMQSKDSKERQKGNELWDLLNDIEHYHLETSKVKELRLKKDFNKIAGILYK